MKFKTKYIDNWETVYSSIEIFFFIKLYSYLDNYYLGITKLSKILNHNIV